MAYGDFKNSTRRTASDKILHNKAFSIAENTKYDGQKCGLPSMIYKIFDKRTSGSGIKKENVLNMLNLFIWKYVKEFAEELLENLKKKMETHLL